MSKPISSYMTGVVHNAKCNNDKLIPIKVCQAFLALDGQNARDIASCECMACTS
jgi:hypothetical protein